MAQIKKRSGFWQARIQWMDTDGKRHSKSKAGFKTKKLAQAWAIDQENQLNRGVKIDKSAVFADFFVQWYERYKAPKISDTTLARYHTASKSIRAYFKNTMIKDISLTMYQDFINNYGKHHAPASVRKMNTYVRACVRFAILDDYIIKDFTQNVTLTGDKSRSWKVDYLNQAEIKRLIIALESDLRPRYTSRYMILTAIYTGMRLSEIQGLTWKDIDFLHQTINIDKSWDSIHHQFKPTKNESSVRKIKVNAELLNILKQLRSNHSTMVFLNQRSIIPRSESVNKVLRKLLQQEHINRKGFHFHSLRHSHVALLLAGGIDIYAISKRLGHSNTTTTSQVYAYLIDEYKQATDQRIVQALSQL